MEKTFKAHSQPYQRVKQTLTSLGPRLESGAALFFLLALSIAVAVFVAYTALSVFHPYPLDYGEAPLLDQATRLAAGQNLYRPDISSPPYTISNYPPLYALSLVPFVKLIGPTFWAGRIISLLSALTSATFLVLIIYTLTSDRIAAAATGMLFLAIPYVVHWSGLLRIDLLALAFSTTALYVLTRWPAARWSTIAAALTLVAAIFTRQSYALAAPFAAFVWLWAHDRRRALSLAAMVAGLALTLFLVLNTLTRGGFYFNIVAANVNEFGVERLEEHLRHLRDTAPILLLIAAAFLLLAPGRVHSWLLLSPYLVGASLSSLMIGKIGSNVNYFLELSAALSLTAGAVLAWNRQRHWLRAGLLLLLTFQVGQLVRTTMDDYAGPLKERLAFQGEIRKLEEIVANTEGTVLADEYMGLVTLQGRPLYIQPFEVTQLANAGLWDQTALLESIRNREFSLVLIHHFPDFAVYKERWTPEMLSAIDRNYRLAHLLADTHVYRPRGWRKIASSEPQTCPGAPWQLPAGSALGVRSSGAGLDFLGWGSENTVPVYAVSDGLLTRHQEWGSALVIQHDDPFRPGAVVWSVYADMSNASGLEAYIAEDLPPGSIDVPVAAGQLLGYQGVWSGRPYWPAPTHLRFAVVSELTAGDYSYEIPLENALDPTLYLGIALKDQGEHRSLQTLQCQE